MILAVRHNIEVAHRLYEVPGKCENIHGHSMWVTLELKGDSDIHGMVLGLDFGKVKRVFREYLDEDFDHRLLLDERDPWTEIGDVNGDPLPGLRPMLVNPTTENIAQEIGVTMLRHFDAPTTVTVWETSVNCAKWDSCE